ncbi:MAG: MFS transporter [Pseudomonas sp.]|uniref:MFS transporter n=1 Tax=Pseudomonas sp. TaxID=306 RepID=UPI003D6EE2B7
MSHAKNANEKPLIVLLLLTMTLLSVFPLDVVLPSFPELSIHFRTSPTDVALSVSLFAVSLALSIMLVGPLSDMWGRKRLLLGGIAVAAIGAVGCAVSREYSWFLVFRVVQAIGCGSFSLSQALIQDLFVGHERQQLRIWMVTASGVFISISPLLGTWLQLQLGWQGSFYVFVALAAFVWLSACWLLKETSSVRAASRGGFFRAYWHVCSDARFMAYWLISALAFACHFSFIVTSPIIFMEHLGLSPYEFAWTLLLYGVAYVGGGTVANVLHRRLQDQTQIVLGLTLIAVSGVVMLWLTRHFGVSAASVLISMLICTIGTTITRPVVNSRAMGIHPAYAGTSTSVGGVLMFLSGGVISTVINRVPGDLTTTLAFCFLILSFAGLGLNALIIQRNKQAVDIG